MRLLGLIAVHAREVIVNPALGSELSTRLWTIFLKTASSGKSMLSPPTRVQEVWKRWPDMNSTMS